MLPHIDKDTKEARDNHYPCRSWFASRCACGAAVGNAGDSQPCFAKWHEQIGDPTLADSILDRLVHNAHRIEMHGESMRKKRGGKEV